MRKIRIIEQITLDGVIQAPRGLGEDGDYPYGGWAAPHDDPAGGEAIGAAHGGAFDLLLVRRTYDIWSGFWPKAEKSHGGQPERGDEIRRNSHGGQSWMGAGRESRPRHRPGRSPRQGRTGRT